MTGKESYRPPKWADDFLTWCCAPEFIEEVQGDLFEAFYKRCKEKGLRYAQLIFIADVLRSVSFRTVHNPFRSSKNSTLMIKNYFVICYRKLMRQKAFAAINIIGLSVSLTGALLIYLYVSHELSYDRFYERTDRIYRVYCAYAKPGDAIRKFPNTPAIFTPTIKRQIPEIAEAVRLFSLGNNVTIQHSDKAFSEAQVYRTDAGFFGIFSAQFLEGNPATALAQPHSVVLSRSTAVKYFGNATQALGKTLEIDTYGKETYQVTGIVEDLPVNAHFHYNALLSIDPATEEYGPQNWLSHWPEAYVLLAENSNPASVETGIRRITEKILDPIHKERFGKTYDERKQAGALQEYRLQPLTDIHLHSADMGGEGSIVYIYLFIAIGLMLICIAGFNYINLSTALMSREAKSVGLRKVLGATKTQLYKLLLTESVSVSVLAATMGIGLTQVILLSGGSFINQFIPGRSLLPETITLLIVLAVIVGLLSGLVPARLLGAFQPVNVLKGQLVQGTKGNRLRQVLVVGQFTVSMGLIMCTFLISDQLTYMQTKSLGFDKEHLLVINSIDKLGEKKTTLKQALANESSIVNGSLCYSNIGTPSNSAAFTPLELIEQGRQDLAIGIPVYIGDHDYLNTLGVELLMGHSFPPNLERENQQIILNEEALRAVGWQDRSEEELIGKIIDVNGLRYELAGIVPDFHFLSLHRKIGPMAILSHYYADYELLMLRIKPGSYQQALLRVQEHWRQLASEVPFHYSFVDEDLEELYRSEQNIAVLFRGFAGLAIFIACLGLLGLAMFSAGRRVKEIGIRKVLGASVRNIVVLLSQNIVKLILLAFLIASPLAWYLMDRWLENFAYRIPIDGLTFVLAGGLTLVIALLTISAQSIRAALTNPAESLRYE